MKNLILLFWRELKGIFVLKLVSNIAFSILTPVSLFFLGELVDVILVNIREGLDIKIISCFSIFTLIEIGKVFGNWLNERAGIKFSESLDVLIGRKIINKFINLEYYNFESAKCADIINRMGNKPQEQLGRVFNYFLDVIVSFTSLFGLLVLYFKVSIILGVFLCIVLGIIVWLDYCSMNMMNTMFNQQSENERYQKYYEKLLGEKDSLFELRLYGAVQYILNKWKLKNDVVLKERLRTVINSKKYFAINTCMLIVWSAIALIWLGYDVIHAKITIGLCITCISSIQKIMENSETMSFSLSRFIQNQRIVNNYYTFMSLKENNKNKQNEIEVSEVNIEFRGVSFTYPETDKEVLHDINYHIKGNESLALVGPNGAGKSTFIKLICGLYKPTKGRVLINGIDAHLLSSEAMHKVISVVFQDAPQYQLSIAENIVLGELSTKENVDKIYNVIDQFSLNEIVKDGIEKQLGKIKKEGIDLSGGQWQKIAIARAVYANSKFMILDEPTASLDPIIENKIYRDFDKIISEKGCLVVSHRLASARLAHKILVLNDGSIVECGTHDDLMHKDGLYAEMFSKQSSWYK